MSNITYSNKSTGGTFTAADANEIKTAVNSKADAITSSTLSSTTWDIGANPVIEKSLSGATAITTTGAVSGVSRGLLVVTGNGNTLSINGTSVTIASSGKSWVNVIVLLDGSLSIVVENAVGATSGGGGSSNITPPAPTGGTVDDTANTFSYTLASGYVLSDHEQTINGGTTWSAASNPISVGDVYLNAGTVGVRVKAATGRNAGPALYNTTAFNVAPSAPDADVTAWASASGISDSTYTGKIDTFVKALKAASIFSTHFDQLQILCGGDETKSKFNLINPSDTDAAHRLEFINGATFASTGVTTNGTNQWINTHANSGNLSKAASGSDYHLAFYQRTAVGVDGFVYGAYDGTQSLYGLPRQSDNSATFKHPNTGENSYTESTSGKGFFIVETQSTAPNATVHKDGVQKLGVSNNGNNLNLPSIDIAFNANNNQGTMASYRPAELSIISIGKGFTATQRIAYENAVANLVSSLGL